MKAIINSSNVVIPVFFHSTASNEFIKEHLEKNLEDLKNLLGISEPHSCIVQNYFVGNIDNCIIITGDNDYREFRIQDFVLLKED